MTCHVGFGPTVLRMHTQEWWEVQSNWDRWIDIRSLLLAWIGACLELRVGALVVLGMSGYWFGT